MVRKLDDEISNASRKSLQRHMRLDVGNKLVRILDQSPYCRLRDPTKFLTCSTNTELGRPTDLNKKKGWSTGIPLNPSPNHDRERLYFACSLASLHHMDQIITDKEMEALCKKCGKKSDLFEDPWLPSTARSELIWPEVPSPYFLEFTWCISTATPDVFLSNIGKFCWQTSSPLWQDTPGYCFVSW